MGGHELVSSGAGLQQAVGCCERILRVRALCGKFQGNSQHLSSEYHFFH